MGKVAIYALLHDSGGIRYIGRAVNPEVRARVHWRERGDDRSFYWHPKNMWLRSRSTPPQLRTLAWVERQPDMKEDWPFITAARRAFPGKLTNLWPWLDDNAPEWLLFMSLAARDDPNFDTAAFRAQLRIWTPERRAKQSDMLRRWNQQSWADPEYRAKIVRVSSSHLKERWRQDPEFRANQESRLREETRRRYGKTKPTP